MSRFTRILIVVLFAVVSVSTAYLSNVVYNLQNKVAEVEVHSTMIAANLTNLADYVTSSPDMIEAMTPTVVYYEMFTGVVNPITGKLVVNSGTGVVIGDGLILTAKHLVEPLQGNDAFACVMLKDGAVGNVVGWAVDPVADIAVIRVDMNTPCAAVIAEYNYLKPGDQVWAIGNPLGNKWVVSTGIVSCVYDFNGKLGSFMTDAPLNPGNSGSPIFDQRGNVVGIAIAVTGNDIGFVVGVDRITEVLQSLIEQVSQ